MLEQFSLKGKVALVTGSSRGLGWAIADALGGAGAHVVLNGRDAGRLTPRLDEAKTRGWGGVSSAIFDVTNGPAVAAGVAKIEADQGHLDILVNNAGIVIRKPTLETTDTDWQTVIDSDLTACFRLSREAARGMTTRFDTESYGAFGRHPACAGVQIEPIAPTQAPQRKYGPRA